MERVKFSKLVMGVCLLGFSSAAFAYSDRPFYIGADAGIFQGTFSQSYLAQMTSPPANVAETTQQHGYTGGLVAGYSKLFHQQYLLGAQLSGNLDSHYANYANGANSLTYTDTTQINSHIDLTVVPGILLSDSAAAYAKLGVSTASVQDNLTSPATNASVMTRYNSTKMATGLAAGLGVKKFLTDQVSIFAEGNYHDYGVVNFTDFQNYTVTYTHSAHVYSYDLSLGAAYHF